MKDGKTGPSHTRKKIHEIKECDARWYNEGLLFAQHRINRMRCTLCSTHGLDYRCRTGCNIPPAYTFRIEVRNSLSTITLPLFPRLSSGSSLIRSGFGPCQTFSSQWPAGSYQSRGSISSRRGSPGVRQGRNSGLTDPVGLTAS